MDDEDEGDMGKRLLIRGDASLSEGVAFTYARIMLNIWSFTREKANFSLSFFDVQQFLEKYSPARPDGIVGNVQHIASGDGERGRHFIGVWR